MVYLCVVLPLQSLPDAQTAHQVTPVAKDTFLTFLWKQYNWFKIRRDHLTFKEEGIKDIEKKNISCSTLKQEKFMLDKFSITHCFSTGKNNQTCLSVRENSSIDQISPPLPPLKLEWSTPNKKKLLSSLVIKTIYIFSQTFSRVIVISRRKRK